MISQSHPRERMAAAICGMRMGRFSASLKVGTMMLMLVNAGVGMRHSLEKTWDDPHLGICLGLDTQTGRWLMH